MKTVHEIAKEFGATAGAGKYRGYTAEKWNALAKEAEAIYQSAPTTYVLVKHSREYSSGQLEHLASYFDSEAEANEACDQANAAELTKYADGLGKDESEVADSFTAPWLVVQESK